MDRGAWQATVHEIAKSRTRLSDYAENKLTGKGGMALKETVGELRTNFSSRQGRKNQLEAVEQGNVLTAITKKQQF